MAARQFSLFWWDFKQRPHSFMPHSHRQRAQFLQIPAAHLVKERNTPKAIVLL
jgi:hypothetical protein